MGIYKNVMELLVEEEVVCQFEALPPRVSTYVNQVEWAAYALNQLPPLYATSERGLDYQLKQAKAKHGAAIHQAVQRAFVAICRDPIRTATPLQSPSLPVQDLLSELRSILGDNSLEWNQLPLAVKQALEQPLQGRITHLSQQLTAYSEPAMPLQHQYQPAQAATASSNQNRTAAAHASTKPQFAADSHEPFGWDDPLYSSR